MKLRRDLVCVSLIVSIVFSSQIAGCKKEEQAGPGAGNTPAKPTTAGASAAPSGKPGPLAALEPPKPAELIVSGVDICKAYLADEKAGDEKYKGKFVEVSGVVASAGSPGLEAPSMGGENWFVVFATTDMQFPSGPMMRCYAAPADSARCNLLSQKQTITFRGTCNGKAQGGHASILLDFKGCRIIETGKDPSRVVTAEEIAGAYAKDAAAAVDEYKYGRNGSKDTIVKGTVQKADESYVWLDGGKSTDGKPLRVRCFWPGVVKPAVGQPITIKCDVGDFQDGYLSVSSCILIP